MKIALIGAGGKMGCRLADNLVADGGYELACVEISDQGKANLAERGLQVVAAAVAVPDAEVVILAVPDRLIGRIAAELVPTMRAGAMLVGLDPAAPYAGVLPERGDVTYFVAHPCHPSLFNDETEAAAKRDWFGGVARQDIVCALVQGPEADYAIGERVARVIFAPVMDSYRVDIEQMALLEPTLVETFAATMVTAFKEGLEAVVELGVPRPAAESFLLGHLRTEIGIIFGYADFPLSDGAKLAVERAKRRIFRDDWKQIFTLEETRRSVAAITEA